MAAFLFRQPLEGEGGLPHAPTGFCGGCGWNGGCRAVVPLLPGLFLVSGKAHFIDLCWRTERETLWWWKGARGGEAGSGNGSVVHVGLGERRRGSCEGFATSPSSETDGT